MGKRIAAIQSSYVPWKGYFDAINCVDEFVLLDDVQYTKRDWRNRNRIKSVDGSRWLTVPVQVKGRFHQRIDETLIADPRWGRAHWSVLHQTYRRAPHFDQLRERFAPLYLERSFQRLSDLNRALLEAACRWLGITTPLRWSTDYQVSGTASRRLLELCLAAGADEYVSGPAARAYLDVELFAAHGVRVRWIDYRGYPPYEQFGEPFEHTVSVLDVLAHLGDDAPRAMKTFGVDHGPFL